MARQETVPVRILFVKGAVTYKRLQNFRAINKEHQLELYIHTSLRKWFPFEAISLLLFYLSAMTTVLGLLPSLLPWLGLVGVLGSIYYVWYRVFSYQGIPSSLAFANSDGSFLSRGRASLGSVLSVDALLWAGHRDVSADIPPSYPFILKRHS